MYSIELSEKLYLDNVKRFKDEIKSGHIKLKNGNSADQISVIINELSSEGSPPVLFFLDGHFSAGITALGDAAMGGETPILSELAHCLQYASMAQSAIVIDDSRMFIGFDDAECKANRFCYPSIKDIMEIVCASKYGKKLRAFLANDQIVFLPKDVVFQNA